MRRHTKSNLSNIIKVINKDKYVNIAKLEVMMVLQTIFQLNHYPVKRE